MPRYFFDLLDDDQLTPDVDGTDMETRQKARKAAVKLLPDVIKTVLPNGEYRRVEVTVKEQQEVIYRATMIFFEEYMADL